jgi:hypothetical protein
MLPWLDQNPLSHLVLVALTVGTLGTIVLRDVLRDSATEQNSRSDWRWGWAIVAILFAGRWPSLFVSRQFNTDEGLQIAGAITLRHDPLFWRSVFGTTTGPLDFYVLLPLGTLFGADNYFTARLTGLLLIAGALIFAHQALASTFGRTIARVSTFSTVCFEAFTVHPDFLHYSTELLPISLLSSAFYLSLRLRHDGDRHALLRALAVGALLGMVPFAKLQAAPIAAAGGLMLVGRELVPSSRSTLHFTRAAKLVVGALMPLALFAIMLATTDDRDGAFTSFISANVAYAQNGFGSVFDTFAKIAQRGESTLFLTWLGASCVVLLMMLPWIRTADHRSRTFVLSILIWLLISAACIAAPRRPFLHYLQLSVIPITLVVGAGIGMARVRLAENRNATRKLVLLGAFILPMASILFSGGFAPNPFLGKLALYQRYPAGDVGQVIQTYVSAGEALAVWGWNARYYVETGTRQATRHAMTDMEILVNPYSAFFRSRYLEDFAKAMPPVFVDGSFVPGHFTNREIAHDISYPELGELIGSSYELVQTIEEVRIFVRRDRLAERRSEVGLVPASHSSNPLF